MDEQEKAARRERISQRKLDEQANMEAIDRRIERQRELGKLILPLESKLKRLTKEEIEEIVIWLKAIKNPPVEHEDNRDNFAAFDAKLARLRKLPKQIEMQKQAFLKNCAALGCGVLIGILLTAALLTGIVTGHWLIPGVILIPAALLYFQSERLHLRAILISKEQDQRHLLESFRACSSVTELMWSGFFGYNKVDDGQRYLPEESLREAERTRLTQLMRDALYRNAYEGNLAETLEYLKL